MKLSEIVKGIPLIKCNELLKRDDLYFVNLQDEDGNDKDIFSLYITDEEGKELFNMLKYPTAYIHDLKIYVVGITHYGISWDDIEVFESTETVKEKLKKLNKEFYENDEVVEKLCELTILTLDNVEAVNKLYSENPSFKYDLDYLKTPVEEMNSSELDYLINEIKRLTA